MVWIISRWRSPLTASWRCWSCRQADGLEMWASLPENIKSLSCIYPSVFYDLKTTIEQLTAYLVTRCSRFAQRLLHNSEFIFGHGVILSLCWVNRWWSIRHLILIQPKHRVEVHTGQKQCSAYRKYIQNCCYCLKPALSWLYLYSPMFKCAN